VKGVANKELTTKSTSNQPNAMAARFAHLEALVMSMASSMVTQVKPITPAPHDFSS
jgi:hypothetical protein